MSGNMVVVLTVNGRRNNERISSRVLKIGLKSYCILKKKTEQRLLMDFFINLEATHSY